MIRGSCFRQLIGYYTLNLIFSILYRAQIPGSDNALAHNKFADFFTEKITSLQNSLDSSSSALVHLDDSSHASCVLCALPFQECYCRKLKCLV